MNDLLRTGQTISTDSGHPCQVEQFIGSGGQGEVYKALWLGKRYAIKWYYTENATPAQRQALQVLVKMGPPSDRFLWPLDLAFCSGQEGFGYLMRLREPQYKGIIDLMAKRIDPTFKTLATTGLQLAQSYLTLHANGLCYCDINWNNVFFDPVTGDTVICDNDNVIVNGQHPAIGGMLGFMAPEIARAEAFPSIETDKFSLGVLLFYIFFVDHPLEGKKKYGSIHCFDAPAKERLYGTEPIYIFDPKDDSNRPVPGRNDNAIAYQKVYPSFFKKTFEKAFTDGIRDPKHGRVTENEWMAAMSRLKDSIFYCQNCRVENFYDLQASQSAGGRQLPCWSCHRDVVLPFRIRIGRHIVMVNHDTQLYPHHIDDKKPYDFSGPIGEVSQHPKDSRLWGLKNLTADKWVTTASDGTIRDVEAGRSVTLTRGTKVNFGKVEGEVQY